MARNPATPLAMFPVSHLWHETNVRECDYKILWPKSQVGTQLFQPATTGRLLSSLRHPDLVMFLGACLEPEEPLWCISEYLPEGDLERYFMKMQVGGIFFFSWWKKLSW